MLTIDALKEFGADTKEGLERCMGNEAFYIRLVKMIPGDANFERFYQAIDEGDLDTAFEAAHALKGVVGNLSLTPLTAPVNEVTELLRSRTDMDYSSYAKQIKEAHQKLIALCQD